MCTLLLLLRAPAPDQSRAKANGVRVVERPHYQHHVRMVTLTVAKQPEETPYVAITTDLDAVAPRRVACALVAAGVLVAATAAWSVPSRLSSGTMLALGLIQTTQPGWKAPPAVRRCDWVVDETMAHNLGKSYNALREQFTTQSKDVNTFYRGTAYMFWKDFVQGGWGLFDLSLLGVPTTQADGTPLQRTSTWTWITGDQHLSNFGAWMNRNNEVIFGVNDFDEAAIFDFQIDVSRRRSLEQHAPHARPSCPACDCTRRQPSAETSCRYGVARYRSTTTRCQTDSVRPRRQPPCLRLPTRT